MRGGRELSLREVGNSNGIHITEMQKVGTNWGKKGNYEREGHEDRRRGE